MTTPITPEQAIAAYQRLVQENDTAAPILLFCAEATGIPQPALIQMDGEHDMQWHLNYAIPHLVEAVGRADWVLLNTEAYMQKFSAEGMDIDTPEDLERVIQEHYQPGEIGDARKAGDLSIQECMNLTLVTADGTGDYFVVKPFERVGGEVIWGEAQIVHGKENTAGGVPDCLRLAFK